MARGPKKKRKKFRQKKKRVKKKKPAKKRAPKKKRAVRRKKIKRKKPKKKAAKKRKPKKRSKKRAKKKVPKKRPKRNDSLKPVRIESFHFQPGQRIGLKYDVISQIGQGWEAEVYLVRERETGIESAAKIFFPHRNPRNKVLKFYAKKLHKLRNCSALIRYQTLESFYHHGQLVTFLVSEYVEGQLLSDYLKRQPGRRLHFYQALHLLHSLAVGMEQVHQAREYHGDLHSENVIIQRHGLSFDLKILDLFHWDSPRPENIQDDVIFMIRLFYDVLGGAKHYPSLPSEVKEVICGLKATLIIKKFKTAGHLRRFLENMEWFDSRRR